MYKESAILGLRVFTIPIEDFIYIYSLLTLNLGIYYLLGGKRKIQRSRINSRIIFAAAIDETADWS